MRTPAITIRPHQPTATQSLYQRGTFDRQRFIAAALEHVGEAVAKREQKMGSGDIRLQNWSFSRGIKATSLP